MTLNVNGRSIIVGANAYFSNATTTFLSTLNNQYQGTVAGFAVGGDPVTNSIDRFPFAQDTYVADHGDLALGRAQGASATSVTDGYSMADNQNVKFPFANQSGSTVVTDFYPDLFAEGATTYGIYASAGSSSETHGYIAGGIRASSRYNPAPWGLNYDYGSRLYKFSFAQNEKSTLIGTISPVGYGGAGQTSISTGFGYISGRFVPAFTSAITRWPFASDSPGVSVANLTVARAKAAGISSQTHGYSSGGENPLGGGVFNIIDKFPFASIANATDVGDITTVRNYGGGINSTTNGYHVGTVMDKFPFSTDANATNIGSLLSSRDNLTGNQD